MKKVLGVFFLILPLLGNTQNLVKNPSFEEYLECPNALGTFDTQVQYWSTPTQGSTDYFNTCSKVMSAPENFNGVQSPKAGKAYAGFYFYAPGDYREYIQAQLTRTLKKDKKYQLEFYVSLAEGSDFAVKDFGVALSYKPLDVTTKKELSKGRLFRTKGNRFQVLEINHSDFHEDKSVWLKIKASFTAEGFERYLILGNLRDNKTTRKVQTKRKETKKGAYYYIDMVSLIHPDGELPQEEIETDTLYVFQNVHFDFDQFQISNEAEEELALVREKLLNNKRLRLEIHGHTDNLGTTQYNQILSEKRAKVIADYFVGEGIDTNRISWFGHGAKKPMASNTSHQDRAKNRRVEFQVVFP
ncbi:MAG: OmpA family protein [Bacteroidota bacterium]